MTDEISQNKPGHRLWRDPLIHFLIFGVLLFIGHAVWSSVVTRSDRELIVDTREIARQSDLFTLENGRPPSEAELQGIIVAFVEEEVWARDAVALGLDADDTVIRRRLAQKMRLVSDAGPVDRPDDDTLRAWFNERQDAYVDPERRRVQHVFFSVDRRENARSDAQQADLSDWERTGDPFIVARQIGPVTRVKLQQDYGEAFAMAAFTIEIGTLSNVVETPFGLHRLRVTQISPRIEPEFDRLRDRILADWSAQTRKDRAAQAIRDRIARYDVIVEE